MDVFDGLDEMGLSEDEIRRVRLVDPDRSELHGRLLALAMDECRSFSINDFFRQDRKLFTAIRRMVDDNLSRLGSPRSWAAIRTSVRLFGTQLRVQTRTYRLGRAVPMAGTNSPSTRPLDMAAGFSLIAEKFAKRQHAATRVADA